MNIAKIIAKMEKEGYEALTQEEVELLKENKGLLSPSQLSKFSKGLKQAEEEEEEEDEEEEEEEEEEEDEEDEIDAKALKKMISKGVKDEIGSQMDAMADQLASKFARKAKTQRKKAIDTGVKADDPNRSVTRDFVKALVNGDKTELAKHQKTTTFNQTGDDARGGYTVPDELMAEVLRIAEKQYGLCRREFRYLPFSGPGNSRTIPTLATSVSTYWVNEGASKSGTNATFGLVTQTLKKLAAIVPFTEEILEDSAINLTQFIAELFAEAVSKEEDTQFLNGSGSPWTGILQNGSVNTVSLGTAEGVSDITFEKLVDMQDELDSGALPGAKYYMNRTVYSYLRKLRASAITADDGKGQFLLPPSKRDIEDILDYPIELSDAMPGKTLATADTGFVIFGNLKMAAIFGDKQQIRTKLLDQATVTDGDGETSINLAEQNMLALRLEERVGYLLALPGAVVVLKTGSES